ncbi:MAG: class IV adenylate cyclase, partial [Candidatus Hydrothermarchaeales archaeon]
MLEIEVKAYVKDFDKIENAIVRQGGRFEKEEIQKDTYFNHPLRDFAKTDEALRIRRVD